MKSELDGATVSLQSRSISWVNRVTRWVDGLPIPGPLCYAAGGLVGIFLFLLNDWLLLGQPLAALEPFQLILALGPAYTLGLIHFLDARAGRALVRMRPLLKDPEVYPELRRQLTMLPSRPALLASFGGLLVGVMAVVVERVALPSAFRPFILPTDARVFVEIWLIFTWFSFGALFIHTVHQLRVINRIYTHHTTIDLDNYQMLFHFSRVSAFTAIGLLVIPYAWFAAIPNLYAESAGYTFGLFFPVFALMSFLWPLIGVHNLMAEAKERTLCENAAVGKTIRQRLFDQVAAGTLNGASDLHDALAAIHLEREALLRIPTWPWQPGTPRSVVAALALPLIVWFLQWVLQKMLGL